MELKVVGNKIVEVKTIESEVDVDGIYARRAELLMQRNKIQQELDKLNQIITRIEKMRAEMQIGGKGNGE